MYVLKCIDDVSRG